MRSLFKGNAAEKLAKVRAGLRHAFAVEPEDQLFSIDDVQLLERIAETIVKRGMAAPATMFLESMGPMNFLGSQALHFITPIIDCAFDVKEVEQVARLLERRDTVTRLILLIEAKSAPKGATAQ
ncbi:MAG: hypothetical protein OEV99_17250 [Nitrospira sp.]|nr:hypothetical protein [Nitrospira sp.]MDH4371568.1 hypothetical protein [Nitrospira sp.]MDH5348754.1 hypothetical protein [Nitrospira sp.]MDH5498841.1 hypothetical protein [Nitrospira sp.]MDH5724208.1 hypothetical protein [Nitrospira sp.]